MSRRLTHGEFLEKTNVKHGNKFIYLTKYSKSHDKIHIKCLDCGDEFWQLAYSHLDGRGCLNCANIKRTKSHKDFVKEAYVKHNNQFEYLSKYINNQTKIDIKCLKCNNVFSQEPRSHLRFGSQCPHSEKIKDHNAFLLKANIVHPNKFRYLSLFIKDAIKIKIECLDCDNVFEQRPSSHLSGVGCSDCSKKEADIKKRKSHKDFVADANLIHFNKFEYLTEYLNSKEKIQIKCLDCENIFYQKPSSHLEGRGCKECADFHSGGYCEDYFNDRPEMRDTLAILYFYKFNGLNDKEEFYKVGITINEDGRYFSKDYFSELLFRVRTTLYNAFQKEQKFIEDFKKYKHIPKHKFGGWTECFSSDVYNVMFNK